MRPKWQFCELCFLCWPACCWVKLSAQTHSSSRSHSDRSSSNKPTFMSLRITFSLTRLGQHCLPAHVGPVRPLASSPSASWTLDSFPPLLHPLHCFRSFLEVCAFLLLFASLSFPKEQCLANVCHLPTLASDIIAAPH